MNRQTAPTVVVFLLLVAIAAAGRIGQPLWNFTPLAAIGLFAGRFYANRLVAIAAPLTALLISDLFVDRHISFPVMLTVYAALAAPALLGGWLRKPVQGRLAGTARWAVCLLGPTALFYLSTNFAVWAFQSDYPKTPAGLIECYVNAVPFCRWMLAGDLFYTTLLFGAAALAGVIPQRMQPQQALLKAE